MLEIKNLVKAFNGRPVLKGVSLQVGPEIKVVVGLNGSGKSTLLKVVAGILPADGGQVFLDGKEITSLPPEERGMGYVPQRPALFPHLSVRQNLLYGLRGKREDAAWVRQVVDLMGLGEYLDRRPAQLSGGYQSRVALARALIPRPRAMLLDEPLSSLDVAIRQKLWEEFHRVLRLLEVPVLYVTHDREEAERVGESFALLVGGVVQEVDSARQAFAALQSGVSA
ncbi:ABC transporter ATP-binding protein [Ammonifex thiophilus]|uniref:ABC transporter ATP-binding protein n=1 Tax=Ammonifex thiophilus TaxID=444093 RepID=A0A3D8P8I0_9THEO|nr:ABC transporter ATP-binding protein [Ammonifex thiophilus]RDV84845.1 ABC transporter ATP-binding protein [Ammonifex thiophilus]